MLCRCDGLSADLLDDTRYDNVTLYVVGLAENKWRSSWRGGTCTGLLNDTVCARYVASCVEYRCTIALFCVAIPAGRVVRALHGGKDIGLVCVSRWSRGLPCTTDGLTREVSTA